MRGTTIAIVGAMTIGALGACGGKTVYDDSPWKWDSNGVSDNGPSYLPLTAAQTCGENAIAGDTGDACLGDPLACAPDDDSCTTFDDEGDVQGGSLGSNGTKTVTNGVAHFHSSSATDEATTILVTRGNDHFDATLRMKVSSGSGNVTIALGSVELTDDEARFSLEVVGSTLQMCRTGSSSTTPVCIEVGRFGRDVWHRMHITLQDHVLSASVDCTPKVSTTLSWMGALAKDFAGTIAYGVYYPTCQADVFVDIAKSR